MRRLAFLFLMMPLCAGAQKQAANNYPQDFFRNPLEIPILLAGNFGECRPGHFHSGVDIKTQGKENLHVYAAADGYISRIKTEKGGFGHALYITHPNGYTTLYAHLNDFVPAYQKYLRREQYKKERWDLDLVLPPGQFPVKKGQQIAFSGNTGGSTAPHLHFEIRNTKTEHPLNPELFRLPITDKVPPVLSEIVFYKGNIYETANKVTVALGKKGDEYKPLRTDNAAFRIVKDTVYVPLGQVGVGINTDDYMDGSDNTLAFYTAQLSLDNSPQVQVTLDDIGYDESRYVHAYADYKARELNHKWVQCLFQLPGNRLGSIFSNMNSNNGRIDVSDGRAHRLAIEVTDDKGNIAFTEFYVVGKATVEGNPANCTPFFTNKTNNFDDPNVSFVLDEKQLYDDICFEFSRTPRAGAYSDQYQLHYPYVPIHHYFDLQIKPNKPVPFELRDKVALMYTDGKDEEGSATTFSDKGWYKARVRDFGTYWLNIDTTAPVIKSIQKNGANLAHAKQIMFEVKDAATSVKTYRGELNGKWICFEQHGSKFFYTFDEHCPRGKHELLFTATDENGNSAEYRLGFTR